MTDQDFTVTGNAHAYYDMPLSDGQVLRFGHVATQMLAWRLEHADPASVDWVAKGAWLYQWAGEMHESGTVDNDDLDQLRLIADAWEGVKRPPAHLLPA